MVMKTRKVRVLVEAIRRLDEPIFRYKATHPQIRKKKRKKMNERLY